VGRSEVKRRKFNGDKFSREMWREWFHGILYLIV
jgi:hypothetical protein